MHVMKGSWGIKEEPLSLKFRDEYFIQIEKGRMECIQSKYNLYEMLIKYNRIQS